MRSMLLGVVMFSLGLMAAPGRTVAQQDEALGVLCHRFDAHVAPIRERYKRFDDAIRRKSGSEGYSPTEAVVISLDAVRKMVCVAK